MELEQLAPLIDELVRLNVDIILASSTPEAVAAKKATKTIPIIVYSGNDPVAAGLVDSLARPGGNITGFTFISPLLAGKRLELLKETIPKLSRVAMVWEPEDPVSAQEWKDSQLTARKLGLQLHSMEVRSSEAFGSAFNEAMKMHNTAVAVTRSSVINRNQKAITEFSLKNRLPAIYPRGDFAERGGLMAYGADQTEAYRRVAWMVDRVLKGTKPSDIPFEQPSKFELIINLKTAKQIGLTIPPNVLARADKVIK
jgi:putative tryptophan/tyrosine transport system substrate-binding protein